MGGTHRSNTLNHYKLVSHREVKVDSTDQIKIYDDLSTGCRIPSLLRHLLLPTLIELEKELEMKNYNLSQPLGNIEQIIVHWLQNQSNSSQSISNSISSYIKCTKTTPERRESIQSFPAYAGLILIRLRMYNNLHQRNLYSKRISDDRKRVLLKSTLGMNQRNLHACPITFESQKEWEWSDSFQIYKMRPI